MVHRMKQNEELLRNNETDPTADWKEIGPVTAGLFTRCAVPMDRAFYTTDRYTLKEDVNPDAATAAWENTVKVYPFLRYAVLLREGRLIYAVNPLPFIIQETEDVIEPFGSAGNYHMTVLCWHEKTIWFYADHTGFDGTGVRTVMETFFYHYFSFIDKTVYPIPSGLHADPQSWDETRNTDAYLSERAVNPRILSLKPKEKTFQVPEDPMDSIVLPQERKRFYCLRIPSEELMAYAKSIGGTPFSVLSVLLAKTVQTVHPENTLPIQIMAPVSIRSAMGNTDSIRHQVVHMTCDFLPSDLYEHDDTVLNRDFRAFLNQFASKENLRMMAGIYHGICDSYARDLQNGTLYKKTMDTLSAQGPLLFVSYRGTLRTGDYGSRFVSDEFHATLERGIHLQMMEVGSAFHICWTQSFPETSYLNVMNDLLLKSGIRNAVTERIH